MYEMRQMLRFLSFLSGNGHQAPSVCFLCPEWDIEALVASESIWKCLSCFACVERCPRGVKPGKLIDAARQVLIRQRSCDGLSPDEIPQLLDEETPQQLLVSAFRKYRR